MMRQIIFTAYMMALTAVDPILMQRFALIAHVMVRPSTCKSSFFYGQTFSTFDYSGVQLRRDASK